MISSVVSPFFRRLPPFGRGGEGNDATDTRSQQQHSSNEMNDANTNGADQLSSCLPETNETQAPLHKQQPGHDVELVLPSAPTNMDQGGDAVEVQIMLDSALGESSSYDENASLSSSTIEEESCTRIRGQEAALGTATLPTLGDAALIGRYPYIGEIDEATLELGAKTLKSMKTWASLKPAHLLATQDEDDGETAELGSYLKSARTLKSMKTWASLKPAHLLARSDDSNEEGLLANVYVYDDDASTLSGGSPLSTSRTRNKTRNRRHQESCQALPGMILNCNGGIDVETAGDHHHNEALTPTDRDNKALEAILDIAFQVGEEGEAAESDDAEMNGDESWKTTHERHPRPISETTIEPLVGPVLESAAAVVALSPLQSTPDSGKWRAFQEPEESQSENQCVSSGEAQSGQPTTVDAVKTSNDMMGDESWKTTHEQQICQNTVEKEDESTHESFCEFGFAMHKLESKANKTILELERTMKGLEESTLVIKKQKPSQDQHSPPIQQQKDEESTNEQPGEFEQSQQHEEREPTLAAQPVKAATMTRSQSTTSIISTEILQQSASADEDDKTVHDDMNDESWKTTHEELQSVDDPQPGRPLVELQPVQGESDEDSCLVVQEEATEMSPLFPTQESKSPQAGLVLDLQLRDEDSCLMAHEEEAAEVGPLFSMSPTGQKEPQHEAENKDVCDIADEHQCPAVESQSLLQSAQQWEEPCPAVSAEVPRLAISPSPSTDSGTHESFQALQTLLFKPDGKPSVVWKDEIKDANDRVDGDDENGKLNVHEPPYLACESEALMQGHGKEEGGKRVLIREESAELNPYSSAESGFHKAFQALQTELFKPSSNHSAAFEEEQGVHIQEVQHDDMEGDESSKTTYQIPQPADIAVSFLETQSAQQQLEKAEGAFEAMKQFYEEKFPSTDEEEQGEIQTEQQLKKVEGAFEAMKQFYEEKFPSTDEEEQGEIQAAEHYNVNVSGNWKQLPDEAAEGSQSTHHEREQKQAGRNLHLPHKQLEEKASCGIIDIRPDAGNPIDDTRVTKCGQPQGSLHDGSSRVTVSSCSDDFQSASSEHVGMESSLGNVMARYTKESSENMLLDPQPMIHRLASLGSGQLQFSDSEEGSTRDPQVVLHHDPSEDSVQGLQVLFQNDCKVEIEFDGDGSLGENSGNKIIQQMGTMLGKRHELHQEEFDYVPSKRTQEGQSNSAGCPLSMPCNECDGENESSILQLDTEEWPATNSCDSSLLLVASSLTEPCSSPAVTPIWDKTFEREPASLRPVFLFETFQEDKYPALEPFSHKNKESSIVEPQKNGASLQSYGDTEKVRDATPLSLDDSDQRIQAESAIESSTAQPQPLLPRDRDEIRHLYGEPLRPTTTEAPETKGFRLAQATPSQSESFSPKPAVTIVNEDLKTKADKPQDEWSILHDEFLALKALVLSYEKDHSCAQGDTTMPCKEAPIAHPLQHATFEHSGRDNSHHPSSCYAAQPPEPETEPVPGWSDVKDEFLALKSLVLHYGQKAEAETANTVVVEHAPDEKDSRVETAADSTIGKEQTRHEYDENDRTTTTINSTRSGEITPEIQSSTFQETASRVSLTPQTLLPQTGDVLVEEGNARCSEYEQERKSLEALILKYEAQQEHREIIADSEKKSDFGTPKPSATQKIGNNDDEYEKQRKMLEAKILEYESQQKEEQGHLAASDASEKVRLGTETESLPLPAMNDSLRSEVLVHVQEERQTEKNKNSDVQQSKEAFTTLQAMIAKYELEEAKLEDETLQENSQHGVPKEDEHAVRQTAETAIVGDGRKDNGKLDGEIFGLHAMIKEYELRCQGGGTEDDQPEEAGKNVNHSVQKASGSGHVEGSAVEAKGMCSDHQQRSDRLPFNLELHDAPERRRFCQKMERETDAGTGNLERGRSTGTFSSKCEKQEQAQRPSASSMLLFSPEDAEELVESLKASISNVFLAAKSGVTPKKKGQSQADRQASKESGLNKSVKALVKTSPLVKKPTDGKNGRENPTDQGASDCKESKRLSASADAVEERKVPRKFGVKLKQWQGSGKNELDTSGTTTRVLKDGSRNGGKGGTMGQVSSDCRDLEKGIFVSERASAEKSKMVVALKSELDTAFEAKFGATDRKDSRSGEGGATDRVSTELEGPKLYSSPSKLNADFPAKFGVALRKCQAPAQVSREVELGTSKSDTTRNFKDASKRGIGDAAGELSLENEESKKHSCTQAKMIEESKIVAGITSELNAAFAKFGPSSRICQWPAQVSQKENLDTSEKGAKQLVGGSIADHQDQSDCEESGKCSSPFTKEPEDIDELASVKSQLSCALAARFGMTLGKSQVPTQASQKVQLATVETDTKQSHHGKTWSTPRTASQSVSSGSEQLENGSFVSSNSAEKRNEPVENLKTQSSNGFAAKVGMMLTNQAPRDNQNSKKNSPTPCKQRNQVLVRELKHIQSHGPNMFECIEGKIESWQRHEVKWQSETQQKRLSLMNFSSNMRKEQEHSDDSTAPVNGKETLLVWGNHPPGSGPTNLIRELQFVHNQGEDVVESIDHKVKSWQRQESFRQSHERRSRETDNTFSSSNGEISSSDNPECDRFADLNKKDKPRHSNLTTSGNTESTHSITDLGSSSLITFTLSEHNIVLGSQPSPARGAMTIDARQGSLECADAHIITSPISNSCSGLSDWESPSPVMAIVDGAFRSPAVVTPERRDDDDEYEEMTVEVTVHSFMVSLETEDEEWTVMDVVEDNGDILESFDLEEIDQDDEEAYGVVGHGVSDNVSVLSELTTPTVVSAKVNKTTPPPALFLSLSSSTEEDTARPTTVKLHGFRQKLRKVAPSPQKDLEKLTALPFQRVKLKRSYTNPSRLPQMREAALLVLYRQQLKPVTSSQGPNDGDRSQDENEKAPWRRTLRRCFSDKPVKRKFQTEDCESRDQFQQGRKMARTPLSMDNGSKCILDFDWDELDSMEDDQMRPTRGPESIFRFEPANKEPPEIVSTAQPSKMIRPDKSTPHKTDEMAPLLVTPMQPAGKPQSPNHSSLPYPTPSMGRKHIRQTDAFYESVSISFLSSSIRDQVVVQVMEEALRILRPGGILNVLDMNGSAIERIREHPQFAFLEFGKATATAKDQEHHETNTLSILKNSGLETRFDANDPRMVHWTAVKKEATVAVAATPSQKQLTFMQVPPASA